MNRWFRFYDEALDDPKVQRLAPHLFKTWMNLLCLASKDGGKLPSDDDISFRLRLSISDAQQQVEDLILAGLIDIEGDGSRIPHSWPDRQYASDSSAERVRKHRADKKKTPCNVTGNADVTVQKQTQSRTDSDTEAESLAPENHNEAPRREVLKTLGVFGKANRGVSPRLKEKAEGLGLPIAELVARATAPDVETPNAMFRHLCVAKLQKILPRADRRMLAACLTKDGASAYGTVCQMILEAA